MTTFNQNMAELTIDFSDREIYNDVRSQINITETETVVDSGAVFSVATHSSSLKVGAGATATHVITAPNEREVTWLAAYIRGASGHKYNDTEEACFLLGGRWWDLPEEASYDTVCYFGDKNDASVSITSRTNTTLTMAVTNKITEPLMIRVGADYRYTSQPEQTHEELNSRTLMVRAINENSIRKYGRRVMNLVWPLGQEQVQMQSLVDNYRNRYCEPVPFVTMGLQGKSNARVADIFNMKISDKHTVVISDIELNNSFYVNNVDINHIYDNVLEGIFEFEQARTSEDAGVFIIDTSSLDGPDILGW